MSKGAILTWAVTTMMTVDLYAVYQPGQQLMPTIQPFDTLPPTL